uniref:PARP-type domain-containing protein n=1 Tax=Panagrolaimus davidi TaxID=227884 RepID=A0A914Q6D0_9BILA
MSRREKLLHELPFGVDYAKSARARCKYCEMNIPKGELRLSVRYPSHKFMKMQDNWLHERCFWKSVRKDELSEATIYGFEALEWEDQQMLREKIIFNEKEIKKDEELNDADVKDIPLVSSGKDLEALKEQTKMLSEIKKELTEFKLNLKELEEIINANDYYVRADEGVFELTERLADLIVFGVPSKCQKCKEGTLFYDYTEHAYKCEGTDEKACGLSDPNPKRKPLKVPENWVENGFLENRKLPMLKARSYPPGAHVKMDTVTDYPRDRIRRPTRFGKHLEDKD